MMIRTTEKYQGHSIKSLPSLDDLMVFMLYACPSQQFFSYVGIISCFPEWIKSLAQGHNTVTAEQLFDPQSNTLPTQGFFFGCPHFSAPFHMLFGGMTVGFYHTVGFLLP